MYGRRPRVVNAFALSLIVACSDADVPSEPVSTVRVCRASAGGAGSVVSIDAAKLDSALSAGGYLTELSVDPGVTTNDSRNFRTLTAAVAAARAVRIAKNENEMAACRITISVAAGTLRGSTAPSTDPTLEVFPIVLDVPDLTLHGSSVLAFDANGRVNASVATTPTIIAPTTPLRLIGGATSQSGVSEELFVVNGHPTGSKGHGVVIEGFVLRSGHAASDTTPGGQGVLSMRVRDLVIRHNRFEGAFTERIDLRATSADVDGNDLPAGPGSTCDICIAGPGSFTVRNNRIVGGGIPGILMVPAILLPVPDAMEQYTLPTSSFASAEVTNNEVSGHTRKPVGVGVRVASVGVGAPNVVGDSRMVVTGNLIRGNTFGVIAEAGFPVNGSVLRGDLTLSASGNTLQNNCQNDLLVSLSRHTSGLGITSQPYLRNSSFALSLGVEFNWSTGWYAHPAALGNLLTVNGQLVDAGTRVAYDANKVCP